MNYIIEEEIKSLLQSDPRNPLLISHRKQLSSNFQLIANLSGKLPELSRKKYLETEKCRDVVMKNLRTLYEASRDVLLLARKELSFPIDEGRYKSLMDDRIESMSKDIEELCQEVRKQVQDKLK